ADKTLALINAAPAGLTMTPLAVAETAPLNAAVASLAAHDADGDALSYTLIAGGAGLFRLDGPRLVLNGPLDYETQAHQHSLPVQATAAHGAPSPATFTLAVLNVVETTPLVRVGTAGRDTLTGEAGHDRLYGGYGNDALYGGAG